MKNIRTQLLACGIILFGLTQCQNSQQMDDEYSDFLATAAGQQHLDKLVGKIDREIGDCVSSSKTATELLQIIREVRDGSNQGALPLALSTDFDTFYVWGQENSTKIENLIVPYEGFGNGFHYLQVGDACGFALMDVQEFALFYNASLAEALSKQSD